jgi:hypothetical protein
MMTVAPRLVQRSKGLIDIAIPARAGVKGYAISSEITLTAAWGGATRFISYVPAGSWFRSPTLRRDGLGRVAESTQGQTRVVFDPNDYASATMLGDTMTQYIIVEELDVAGAVLSASPVLVVPPANFFATGRAAMIVKGTANAVAGVATGFPPPGASRLLLPKFSDEFTIHNVGTDPVYLALGAGGQEITIPASGSRSFIEAGAWDIWIRGDAGDTPVFEAVFAIVNGLQA